MAIALVEHMGDIIAAEPLSRRAEAEFPAARRQWFVRPPYRGVVENYPAIDDVVSVRCLTEWLLVWGSGAIDTVWDLHLSARECPTCKAPFHKPGPPGEITDVTYYNRGNLLQIQCLSAGLPPISDTPILTPDAAAAARIDGLDLPARFVVIHCTSNEASRDWSREKWLQLVAHLTGERGLLTIEIGAKPHVITMDGERSRSLCGVLSIMETAELVRRATLFIGVDSGPAHLANSVATPGVILLGHYRGFRRYMPYSGFYQTEAGATLVWADGPVATLGLDPVLQAVGQRLR